MATTARKVMGTSRDFRIQGAFLAQAYGRSRMGTIVSRGSRMESANGIWWLVRRSIRDPPDSWTRGTRGGVWDWRGPRPAGAELRMRRGPDRRATGESWSAGAA